MDGQLATAIGVRVRSARAVNHQTQVVVAGLTGITTDYLYQIERGKKLPTLPVLIRLAEVLRVPVSRLLAEPDASMDHRGHGAETGAGLYWALTQPVRPYDPPPVAELHDHVRSAWRIWQTSPYRYSKLGAQLPVLVTNVELAEQRCRGEGERAARTAVQACAADLYGLLRTSHQTTGPH